MLSSVVIKPSIPDQSRSMTSTDRAPTYVWDAVWRCSPQTLSSRAKQAGRILGPDRRENRNYAGPQLLFPGRHRGPLPPVRRPSWTCFQRQPGTDRAPLLHEWCRAQVRARLKTECAQAANYVGAVLSSAGPVELLIERPRK